MIKALSHIRRLPFVKYKQLKMKQKRSSNISQTEVAEYGKELLSFAMNK
jgi:hypothetical protein